ncbi:DUF7604 domain-containing protein [Bifidobacterium felsineum]|nr:SpaA isopeptide-forming pilin-related protein [Bifidobacterium felsineum]
MKKIAQWLNAVLAMAAKGGKRLAAIVVAVAMAGVLAAVSSPALANQAAGQSLVKTGDSFTQKQTKETAEAAALRPAADEKAAADTDLGAPAHRKYIKYNNDGTYWLSLDVTGASRASTEEKREPADVVLVMDSSGSMSSCTDSEYNEITKAWECKAYANPSRWDIAKAAASSLAQKLLTVDNAALPVDQQVQMSVVDFDTKSTIENLGGGQWSTSAQDVINSFDSMDVSYENGGGTNWEAALDNANLLQTNRTGAHKYIVFVSDGAPTFRNSSMNTDCGMVAEGKSTYGDCDYYDGKNHRPVEHVYGTGLPDHDYKNYNFNAAVSAAGRRNGAVLYAVSTGSEANTKMKDFADTIEPKGTFFDGTDATKLANAFDAIIQHIITNSKYQDVLIKDTLSGYAVSTDNLGGTGVSIEASARDVNGDDVTTTDAAAQTMQPTYNQQTKQLELNFPQGTVLSPNVTYTVSIKLKPSDEAYQYFIDHSGQYPSIGDQGTDAEGNTTSSGKPGFYSNADNADGSTTANVLYKTVTQVEGQDPVVSEQKSAAYDRPVIQVNVPSLTLTKAVDNTNAGSFGAKPSDWSLSATKNSGTYGIQSAVPAGDVTTESTVTKQSIAKTLLAPGTYTLGEAPNENSTYQYFGGYSAGDWSCVDEQGNAVKVTKRTDGTQTMNLQQGANVTCTVTNTAKPGAIQWQKVDQSNQSKTLPGSEWTLTAKDAAAAGFDSKTVMDDGTDDAAAGNPDNLKVTGLKWGEYTLEETKAPNGYAKSAQTYDVKVLPAGDSSTDPEFTVNAGKITNKLLAVSRLPLTGGTMGRQWLIAGAGGLGFAMLVAAAGHIIWRKRQLV